MFAFSFSPDCCALGVSSAVSLPPVGTTELASGVAPPFPASTRRSCVYLPAGSATSPSSTQHAVRQRQQIDASGGLQHDVVPTAVVVIGAITLVHADPFHRDIDGVVAAGRCIGQRHAQRAHAGCRCHRCRRRRRHRRRHNPRAIAGLPAMAMRARVLIFIGRLLERLRVGRASARSSRCPGPRGCVPRPDRRGAVTRVALPASGRAARAAPAPVPR